MNCWPSGKYVHLLYMYSILGRGSFCFNYCLNSAWHGGDQFVALLRWYGSPGFFDCGLQLICIVGSGVSLIFLLTIPHRFSLFSQPRVRCFCRCLWFRSGLVALFLKTSERGDSWCTDSSFSPLLVKLSQVFESALLDSILKLAVIPVACAPFPTQILPSSQLCI